MGYQKTVKIQSALVLGCLGQDGSLLCKSLLNKGYKVTGLARSIDKDHNNLKKLGIEREVNLVIGNIENSEFLEKLILHCDPYEIYNLAAQSSVGKSFVEPSRTFKSIAKGTLNILEIARQTNYEGRIFFAGSSEIFGNTQEPANLNYPQETKSPYAIAKQTSLNLVKFYRDFYNINCCTGILFNHESSLRSSTFVTQKIIKAAKDISRDKNKKLELGNINIIRDWGWANEYVEAIQLITNARDINDQIICTGEGHSLKEYISKVFSHFNLNWQDHIEINRNLFRPADIEISVGNPKKLYEDMGWKAKVKFDLLIEKMITQSY